MPRITILTTILLTLIFVALTIRAIRIRRRLLIAVGTGPIELQRALRAHGNFTEYTPMALGLVFLCEFATAPSIVTGALAACLVVGRLAHAWGVSREPENLRFRVTGMALTFIVLGVAPCVLCWRLIATL